jgi:hypothetical protein
MQTWVVEMLNVDFPICVFSRCRDVVASVFNRATAQPTASVVLDMVCEFIDPVGRLDELVDR